MRFRSLVLLVASSLLALPVLADTTYTYTGNAFTQIDDGAEYTTSNFISGSLSVATALDPDSSYTDLALTSFSFTDGLQTITNLNSALFPIFNVKTDDNGDINQWQIDIHGANGEIFFNVTVIDFGGGNLVTFANDTATYNGRSGGNSRNPGPWVTSGGAPVVPEPSSLALLGTGALGMVAATRRRLARR